jgi:hypothetical protein
MRTTEPGSLPLGAADADVLANGVPDTFGDGDAPASVEPQAPRTRAATRAMALTGLWSRPLGRPHDEQVSATRIIP